MDFARLTARQRQLLILGALALAAIVVVAIASSGDGGDEGPQVRRLERGTVLITNRDEQGNGTSIGSGTIISKSGLILTNAHVAAPASQGQGLATDSTNEKKNPASLLVGTFRSEDEPVDDRYIAEVLAVDGYADIAVIQIVRTVEGEPIEPGELDLPAVPLGDSDTLENGENITIVGFPGLGGGFEGAIDVIQGNVAGFERDQRVPAKRGWVKTDAEISGGNSGGLAANDDGRIVGIPTVVQFDLNNATSKGKLRPIRLAYPVIEAARKRARYTSPYFVYGTGREQATFRGWAAGAPGPGCSYQPVKSYATGTTSLTPVWSIKGMRQGLDLRYGWIYLKDEESEAQVVGWTTDTWRVDGPGAGCFYFGHPAQGGPAIEDGLYKVVVLAGPNLKEIGSAVVEVGGTGSSGTTETPTPNEGTTPGGTGVGHRVVACQSWMAAQFADSGVYLEAGLFQNGEKVSNGLFGFTEQLGGAAGFGPLPRPIRRR